MVATYPTFFSFFCGGMGGGQGPQIPLSYHIISYHIITLGLPSPVNKDSLLLVHGIRKKTVDISAPIRYVFSISRSVVGFVSEQKELIICSNPGKQTIKLRIVASRLL